MGVFVRLEMQIKNIPECYIYSLTVISPTVGCLWMDYSKMLV